MNGLGHRLNILPVADDVYVNMRDCGGITFVGVLTTGDTWTLTEAKDASGTGSQVLATISESHYSVTVGSAWIRQTHANVSAVTTTSAQDVICIEVEAAELSDTYDWVKLTSTSTGIVIAIQRGLKVQRAPANLPALV